MCMVGKVFIPFPLQEGEQDKSWSDHVWGPLKFIMMVSSGGYQPHFTFGCFVGELPT